MWCVAYDSKSEKKESIDDTINSDAIATWRIATELQFDAFKVADGVEKNYSNI